MPRKFAVPSLVTALILSGCMHATRHSDINALIRNMSLDEKVEQLHGGGFDTADNTRLGIQGFHFKSCDHGVGFDGPATSFPVSIAAAATFDPALVQRTGAAIATEVRAHGGNDGLGPSMDVNRDPRMGRTQETYGEDPYLSSRMAVAYILGMQGEGIIATAKHYNLNTREHGRTTNDNTVDERSLREIYSVPFEASVKEGHVWSVMPSYNKVNGVYSAENPHLLNDMLRKDWGFQGFVVSDWGAVHSTAPSIKAGTDVEMPNHDYYGDALLAAVKDGSVSMADLDSRVRNVLRAKQWAGLFGTTRPEKPDKSVIGGAEHLAIARQIADEAIVLLKNDGGILPLNTSRVRKVALIGPLANVGNLGDHGSSIVVATFQDNVLDEMMKSGAPLAVAFTPGCGVLGDNTSGIAAAAASAKEADVAVVVVGNNYDVEGEGFDRKTLELPGVQKLLVQKVAAANKNTVVVLMGGSAIATDGWLDRVPAVLMAWYPGQLGGAAVVDTLLGRVNPGGKLPLTFPTSDAQLPVWTNDHTNDITNGRGYRYYDIHNMKPAFPFGYGLSYTTFHLGGIKVSKSHIAAVKGAFDVSFTVTNSGKRAGDEVAQLYVHDLDPAEPGPVRTLKAFQRVSLAPGETKKVTLHLTSAELAHWDTTAGKFKTYPGRYEIQVGDSSRNLPLSTVVTVTPA